MGYRNYIGKVSKKRYEKLKDLNMDQMMIEFPRTDDYWYINIFEIIEKELHCLGKYVSIKFSSESYQRFF